MGEACYIFFARLVAKSPTLSCENIIDLKFRDTSVEFGQATSSGFSGGLISKVSFIAQVWWQKPLSPLFAPGWKMEVLSGQLEVPTLQVAHQPLGPILVEKQYVLLFFADCVIFLRTEVNKKTFQTWFLRWEWVRTQGWPGPPSHNPRQPLVYLCHWLISRKAAWFLHETSCRSRSLRLVAAYPFRNPDFQRHPYNDYIHPDHPFRF